MVVRCIGSVVGQCCRMTTAVLLATSLTNVVRESSSHFLICAMLHADYFFLHKPHWLRALRANGFLVLLLTG